MTIASRHGVMDEPDDKSSQALFIRVPKPLMDAIDELVVARHALNRGEVTRQLIVAGLEQQRRPGKA